MSDLNTESLPEAIDHARLLREHYLRDPHRPGYHFVVPEGVHGPVDPNGALFWKGRYHLCYIYQHQGKHSWGHISSLDLVHWRHHLPALGPGEGDDGIFSGGAFIDENGVATISYWRLGEPDGISLATSTDINLDHWTKHPENPVIRSTMTGIVESDDAVYGSADPSQIWFHNGRYYMLTGNLLVLREFGEKRVLPEHTGDTAYLLVSDDLENWNYLHEFYKSRRDWTYAFEDCMCPDFFPLPSSPQGGEPSGKHMLLFISHTLGCQYYIGTYENDRFTPEQHGRMSWPPAPEQYANAGFHDHGYFAPESLADANGRRIMWAWLFDHRSHKTKMATGWSGEISLPRVLWLGEDGTLHMSPPEELKALRHREWSKSDFVLATNSVVALDFLPENSLELQLTMRPNESGQCHVKVCCAPDGSEETVIFYDPQAGTLNIDATKSSLREGRKIIESAPFALRDGEALELRIFIDKSIVEVYANERQAMVRRIYPSVPRSTGIALFAMGAPVTVSRFVVWEMMPSNPY